MAVAWLVVALWILGAAVLPVTQDESYYYVWAQYLDWGYFDHPPLVALVAQFSRLASGNPLVARLGTLAVGVGTLFVAVSLFKRVGLRSRPALAGAIALTHLNLLGMILGVLSTPDAPLLFAWALTLHELAHAVTGSPRRWITAGLAAGLGLNAKYTMLLIAGVALWTALAVPKAERRRTGLASPWPWAGMIAALLMFVPHVAWNAQNDWITFRFQLRHGFALARPEMPGKLLPSPLPRDAKSPEAALAASFKELKQEEKRAEKQERLYDPALKALNRYVGYYGSQVAIWGALAPLLLMGLWRTRRRPFFAAWRTRLDEIGVDPRTRPMLVASAVIPLGVFGLIALISKVEANWSAMYALGAGVLLLPFALARPRALVGATAANAFLFLTLLAHARFGGILPVRPHHDRILYETHGWNLLARKLESLDGPVFGDSFQLVSMVSFYASEQSEKGRVRQWPGVTRDSELVRRRELSSLSYEDLRKRGSFWLATTDEVPPRMPGFVAVTLTQLRDCRTAGEPDALQEIPHTAARDAAQRCKNPIHEWYLVRYVENEASSEQDPQRNGA